MSTRGAKKAENGKAQVATRLDARRTARAKPPPSTTTVVLTSLPFSPPSVAGEEPNYVRARAQGLLRRHSAGQGRSAGPRPLADTADALQGVFGDGPALEHHGAHPAATQKVVRAKEHVWYGVC